MYERKLNNCNYLIFLREIWLYNLLCLIVGINGKNMYFYDHQVKPNRVCCPAFSKLGLVRTGVILVFMTIQNNLCDFNEQNYFKIFIFSYLH